MKIALYNAKVYVERERFVEAVLVEDRKIKAIGTNEEILALHLTMNLSQIILKSLWNCIMEFIFKQRQIRSSGGLIYG